MNLARVAAAAFALLSSPLQAQDHGGAIVTHVLTSTVTSSGQPIVLPQKDAQIVVSIFDIAPGATLPVHKHRFSPLRHVLAGTLRVTTWTPGRATSWNLVEQRHTGSNIGSDPIKLLVIDLVEKDQPNTELRK